ncbi:phage tail protein [Bartonella sp. B17]
MAISLPIPHTTAFEEALVQSVFSAPLLDDAISEIARTKLITKPASILPYLIDEYGLSELIPYLPNIYQLIEDGIKWQKQRGSLAALIQALSWLDLEATFQAALPTRQWWNSFELNFTNFPKDDANLTSLTALIALSSCLRSDFRRGICGYDAPAFIADHSVLDNAMLDFESGIKFGNAQWSFGRTTEIEHTLSENEGKRLGNWLPLSEDDLKWVNMHYPWVTAKFPWIDTGARARRILMASWFNKKICYLAFYDSDNTLIGYRRIRSSRAVNLAIDGAYHFKNQAYQASSSGEYLYLEAMTDFNDCVSHLSHIKVIVEPKLVGDTPIGTLWLTPQQLTGGISIITTPLSLPLRATVREQIKILVRF